MKIEEVLAIIYVVLAFGGFISVVTWALRQAGPDFPNEPATSRFDVEAASVAPALKRAA